VPRRGPDSELERLLRRCVGGSGLIDRDVVGVAVGDPPLAVFAAEDVGDAKVQGSTGMPTTELAMCSKPTR